MKQVQKTEKIVSQLRQGIGADLDIESVAVFEAIALNQMPLRKKHPIYDKAVADLSLLNEMAVSINKESVPVQLQHDTSTLPKGRVFYGEVVGTELRVLFTVDKTEQETITKIEAGSVDQVSVSILPKHVYNSVSGFDYLGPHATFENIYTGEDPEGNKLGQNGVYGRMVGLELMMEMSLVGKGAAQNARIVPRDASAFGSSYQKLAASGVDPNIFVLTAETGKDTMDLTQLVKELTDAKAELLIKDQKLADLTASNEGLTTQVAELSAKVEASTVDEATALAVSEQLTASQASEKEAVEGLQVVAKKLLTATGNLTAEVPSSVAELNALIASTETALSAMLVAGGKTKDAVADLSTGSAEVPSSFRSARK